jgi:hypothetical protein
MSVSALCDDRAMRARYGLVAVGCVVGLVAVVGPSLTSASLPAPPSTFVAVTDDGHEFRFDVSVYSSTMGAIVRRLASFSDRAFNKQRRGLRARR